MAESGFTERRFSIIGFVKGRQLEGRVHANWSSQLRPIIFPDL